MIGTPPPSPYAAAAAAAGSKEPTLTDTQRQAKSDTALLRAKEAEQEAAHERVIAQRATTTPRVIDHRRRKTTPV